jgi:predicted lipoprotein
MHGRWRWIIRTAVAAGTAVTVYFLPLFHVVSLEQAGQRKADEAFDPADFVDRFWTERLVPATDRAVNATELVEAIERDADSARQRYGRTVGLSSVYYYFVFGTGRVVCIEEAYVGLSLRDDQDEVEVLLARGNIFGNAVRDGTGLLDVNDFSNSQDFNALSSGINRRIEERVLPALRKNAAVGDTIRFAGCAEIVDEGIDLEPLRIVPFVVEEQEKTEATEEDSSGRKN